MIKSYNTISRRIVRFAQYQNADVVIEDLEGCRKSVKKDTLTKECKDMQIY